jgi:hypothetical protein
VTILPTDKETITEYNGFTMLEVWFAILVLDKVAVVNKQTVNAVIGVFQTEQVQ